MAEKAILYENLNASPATKEVRLRPIRGNIGEESSTKKIDGLDAKILKDLLWDGRRSFADIAKECQVTKNTVWKRYNRLKKEAIIVGSTIQMDYASMGFPAVATIQFNVDSSQKDQVIERLGKMPNIVFILQFNVIQNIRVITRLRDLSELDHIKEIIRRQNPVKDLKTHLWIDVKNAPQNLVLLPPSEENQELPCETNYPTQIPTRPTRTKSIDEVDRKIIEKLSKDGRLSFRKIAQEIGVSTDTVAKRYERLKKDGVINVSVQLDLTKLGYQAMLDFSLAFMSQQETIAIVEEITKIPDVTIIIKTSGEYDLQVTALIREIKQLFEIQERISRIPNITKLETSARKVPTVWPTANQYISTF